MKVSLSPTAIEDLKRVESFLRDRNVLAANLAGRVIREAIASIGRLPARGKTIPEEGARRLTIAFGRRAYLLDYRVNDRKTVAVVLRVRHSREAR